MNRKELTDDNYSYVNMTYYNDSKSDYRPAILSKNFSDTIVDKPSNHFVSVIRAQIPLETVPLFNIESYLYPDSANPNTIPPVSGYTYTQKETYYSLSMEYAGTEYKSNVFWQPLGPVFSDTNQYEVYNYNSLIDCWNRALVTVQGLINTANPGLVPVVPFFKFNSSTEKIELLAPANVFSKNLPNPVYIRVNTLFYDLINTMPYDQFTFSDIRLEIDPIDLQVLNSVSYAVTSMESSTALCGWNSLRNILFYSNLPCRTEYANTVGTINQDDIQLPILADIAIDASGHICEAIYNPTSQYRLVNMNSESPIRTVQIQVYYQDKTNKIYPLYISPNSNVNMKLAFINKELYYNSNNNILKYK